MLLNTNSPTCVSSDFDWQSILSGGLKGRGRIPNGNPLGNPSHGDLEFLPLSSLSMVMESSLVSKCNSILSVTVYLLSLYIYV